MCLTSRKWDACESPGRYRSFPLLFTKPLSYCQQTGSSRPGLDSAAAWPYSRGGPAGILFIWLVGKTEKETKSEKRLLVPVGDAPQRPVGRLGNLHLLPLPAQ